MSLGTYAQLQAAMGTVAVRSDMATYAPDCIALAEARLNRDLRVRRMIARATATISEEYSAVPVDFIAPRTFIVDEEAVTYVTPDKADELSLSSSFNGAVKVYTVVGGEFRYLPIPTSSVSATLTYWQRVPDLASNSTNWLLTTSPDAYLYGALVQWAMIASDERLPLWAGLYDAAIASITAADRAETLGAVLYPQVNMATP
jgi:hypothetical protein